MVEAMEQMDSLRFGRLNQEFHAVFHERCPNPAVVDLLRDVARRLDAIRRTVFVQIPYRGAASVAEHRALIELIAAGAPAATRSRPRRASTSCTRSRASAPGRPSISSEPGAGSRPAVPSARAARQASNSASRSRHSG